MNGRQSITKEATLHVQSNQNTYAANFEIDSELEPAEIEFAYRTTFGHRPPHLQIHSVKFGAQKGKFTYSFIFLLMDYPIHSGEILSVICKFYLSPSK
jgi:hypothetical protein